MLPLLVKSNVFPVVFAGDGDLFLWGSNKHGQLTSTEPFLPSPTLMRRSLLGGEKVIHVWSGWTHIVAQTGETTHYARYAPQFSQNLTGQSSRLNKVIVMIKSYTLATTTF